jgi:hypothetical protein
MPDTRTCAGMIPDSLPDTEPATATDAVVARMLAAARVEGLPQPISYIVYPRDYDHQIKLHVDDMDDRDRWQKWWTHHGAEGWKSKDRKPRRLDKVFHELTGQWRGWTVELVHLTPRGEQS